MCTPASRMHDVRFLLRLAQSFFYTNRQVSLLRGFLPNRTDAHFITSFAIPHPTADSPNKRVILRPGTPRYGNSPVYPGYPHPLDFMAALASRVVPSIARTLPCRTPLAWATSRIWPRPTAGQHKGRDCDLWRLSPLDSFTTRGRVGEY